MSKKIKFGAVIVALLFSTNVMASDLTWIYVTDAGGYNFYYGNPTYNTIEGVPVITFMVKFSHIVAPGTEKISATAMIANCGGRQLIYREHETDNNVSFHKVRELDFVHTMILFKVCADHEMAEAREIAAQRAAKDAS